MKIHNTLQLIVDMLRVIATLGEIFTSLNVEALMD